MAYFDEVRQQRMENLDPREVLETAANVDTRWHNIMRREAYWHNAVVPILLIVIGYFMDPRWLWVTIPIALISIPLMLWKDTHGTTPTRQGREGPDSHGQAHTV